jgi:hypothetical protein
MRSFITCTLCHDKVKEYEMGRACGMHGGEEECIKDFGGKARRNKTSRKT